MGALLLAKVVDKIEVQAAGAGVALTAGLGELVPRPGGEVAVGVGADDIHFGCLLYTSPSPRDKRQSRMPSSA